MDKPEIRYITNVMKASDGNITDICNPNEAWSPVSKELAITQIESNICNYFVCWQGFSTGIKVVMNGNDKKYLRTYKDRSQRNNLEDLPNCDL